MREEEKHILNLLPDGVLVPILTVSGEEEDHGLLDCERHALKQASEEDLIRFLPFWMSLLNSFSVVLQPIDLSVKPFLRVSI